MLIWDVPQVNKKRKNSLNFFLCLEMKGKVSVTFQGSQDMTSSLSAVCCYIKTFTISNTLGNMPLSFGFLVPFNYQNFLLCLQPYLS